MTYNPLDHVARFKGAWRVTVTCSCGWIGERQTRRSARESYRAHVILTAYADEYDRRRRPRSVPPISRAASE